MITSRANLVERSDWPAMNWRDCQRDIVARYCWLVGGMQLAAVVHDEWANGGEAFLTIGESIVVGLAIGYRRSRSSCSVARLAWAGPPGSC